MARHWARFRWLFGQPLTWLLTVFFCTTGGLTLTTALLSPTNVDLTLTPAVSQIAKRMSEAVFSYGWCDGVMSAVVLFPEPCDWEEARQKRMLSMR